MKSKWFSPQVGLFLLIVIALLWAMVYGISASLKPPIEIAVVTSDNADSTAMRNGVNLYINKVKSIDGHPVRVNFYNDEGNVDRAVEIAREIASNPNNVAVIGHLYSNTTLAAGEIYRSEGIPAVSGTASATGLKDNKWLFSIIPGNDQVGTFLANYANRVLQLNNAVVIYDSRDPYSTSLKDGFTPPFKGLGGTIHASYDLGGEANIDLIVGELLRSSNSSVKLIFVATQKEPARDLIVALRRKGIQTPILGGDALGGTSFVQVFAETPEEQIQPGYFTDNIYASAPIIFDNANKNAQDFFYSYKNKYGTEPIWTAASAYDATHVVIEALEHLIVGHDDLPGVDWDRLSTQEKRSQIHEHIAGHGPGDAVEGGLNGEIYFGEQNDVVKPIVVGIFSKGQFISASTQYLPIPNLSLVSNLDQELKIVNGRYVHETQIVYTGIEFNEISGLDETTSTYDMDFYIWFRYQGEIDAADIQFLNAADNISLGEPLQSVDSSNGTHYRLYRVKGTFKSTFDFQDYPFDQQKMVIRLRHSNLTRDNLVYVVDAVSIRSTINESVFLSGGDWMIDAGSDEPPYFPGSVSTSSSLGDPALIGLNPETEYATFNAEIPIARDVLSFILRNLLPVFFTLILTYMSYYLPSDEFGERTALLSGSILTIAFFHLSVSSSLRVGYTVALDYAFYAFYAIIMIGLLITMVEWYMERKRKELEENKAADAAQEIENRKQLQANMLIAGKIFFPVALTLLTLTYVFMYGPGIPSSFADSQAQTAVNIVEAAPVPQAEKVILTIGSWRVDDQTSMNEILQLFNESHPNIEARFSPTVGSQYEKTLRLQLEQNIAPDLFYLSAAGGRISNPQEIIASQSVESLAGFPGLTDKYDSSAIETWSYNSEPYGLPLFAVSHGIYYNKDIYAELNLSIPQTWDELMANAEIIKQAGYTPFANGFYTNDTQRIGDLLFTNMAPTFIGGPQGRKQYETGARCFNNRNVVDLFSAINDISAYMPEDRETITHLGTHQKFASGEAAMYFGGSFDIRSIENQNPAFEWSVFAVPPKLGRSIYVNYHNDAAIAINANSPHKAEALILLEWMSSPEFANLIGVYLPGFFPLNKEAAVTSTNPHVKDFAALNNAYRTDVRWGLPNTGLPNGRTLMQEAALKMMRGELTPQQAADQLQKGLAQWYLPAQNCLP